jgi:transposase InsO family protein
MPHIIIYIDVPAEVCLQRIKNRGVPYEQKVDLIYLTKLEERYKQMLSDFKGPHEVIDGLQSREKVLQQVMEAIKSTMYVYTQQKTTAVHQGCDPRCLMPTIPAVGPPTRAQDEEYDRGQIRDVVRNTDPSLHAKGEHAVKYPGGTILSALTNGNTCWYLAGELPNQLPNYDPEHFALVLFQGSAGTFGYSQSFIQQYRISHGVDPSCYDRVDAMEILSLAGDMGWHRAAGPTGVLALAVVPRRGLEAMSIFRSNNGAETVMIHPDTYAIRRFNMKATDDLRGQNPKELVRAYQAEGHMLNMQIRVYAGEWDLYKPLTLHKIKAEEAKVEGKRWETDYTKREVDTGSTPAPSHPADCLYTMSGAEDVWHESSEEDAQAGTPVSQQGGQTEPSSSSSEDSIPVDLPCHVCKDPGQWERMLLCDGGCKRGFHLDCIGFSKIPKGDWFCEDCTAERSAQVNSRRQSDRAVIDLTCETSDTTTKKGNGLAPALYIDLVTPEKTMQQEGPVADDEQEGPVADNDIYKDEQAIHYLRTGCLKAMTDDEMAKKELKRVSKRGASYKFAGGLLYRRPTTRHPVLRLCPEPAARRQIVEELHSMAHMGTKRVLSMLSDRYYWSNMTADVKSVVTGCDACKRKGLKLKKDPELQPIEPADIFRRIHIDCLGPMPKTMRGNKWVCVAVDSLSKWPFAKAMPNKSSSSTAQFLLENVIAEHGVPAEVMSDRGGEFQGEFSDLLQECGIKHKMSSSYHPQGNGLAERMVQNILHALQRAAMHDPHNWDLELPWILLAQRAVKCGSSTKHSPAMMVFGRELMLPAERKRPYESELHKDAVKEIEQHDMDLITDGALAHETAEQLEKRSELLNQAALEARANIERAQEQQRIAYKKRRGLSEADHSNRMPPNSLVLMQAPAKNKLSAGCEGPYQLIKWGNRSRALISDAEGKKWWVNGARLSPYGPPPPPPKRTADQPRSY